MPKSKNILPIECDERSDIMQIDNNSLKKFSNMNDSELKAMILSMAKESGLSLNNVSTADLSKIRDMLESVSAGDPDTIAAISKAADKIRKPNTK